MKKKIIDFVEEYLSSVNCKVEKGYTRRTYRVVFNGMIAGVCLTRLVYFCRLNKFIYYVTPSLDATNKVDFVIYK